MRNREKNKKFDYLPVISNIMRNPALSVILAKRESVPFGVILSKGKNLPHHYHSHYPMLGTDPLRGGQKSENVRKFDKKKKKK